MKNVFLEFGRHVKQKLKPLFRDIGFFEQRDILRMMGLKKAIQFNWVLARAHLRNLKGARNYHVLSEPEIRTTPKSDTLFILGSGYSLNDITPEQWREISKHDTLGFTGSVYQKWIPLDYHLVRGWGEGATLGVDWVNNARSYADLLEGNPFFKNTILLLQGEYFGHFCNTLLGYNLLRSGRSVYRYRTARGFGPPTSNLSQGIRHITGTLSDVVNFAYCVGWKKVVLLGVDLYDNRYFWLKSDETWKIDYATGKGHPDKVNDRGGRYDQDHPTVKNGILPLIENWKPYFDQAGIELSVYNPKSLLASVLPVYKIRN